jgi:hypothetical protein
MKNLILLLVFSINVCFAQEDYPVGTKYITTIKSCELDNNDTIKYRVIHKYYDSLHNILANENTLSTALQQNSTSKVVLQTEDKYVAADINTEGDTLSMIVYLYDERGNRTHYFQIQNSDTLISQKRIYNEDGNCLKLYTSAYFSDETSKEWKYDMHGNCISEIDYDRNERIASKTKYKNEYDDSGVLLKVRAYTTGYKKRYTRHYVSTYTGNSLRTDNYYDVVGYNYGIQMSIVKGGYQLEEYFENGDLKSLEIFDKNGIMTASVYFTNTEL